MKPSELLKVAGSPYEIVANGDPLTQTIIELSPTVHWDSYTQAMRAYDPKDKIWKKIPIEFIFELAAERIAVLKELPLEAVETLSKKQRDNFILRLSIIQRTRGVIAFNGQPDPELLQELGDDLEFVPFKNGVLNLKTRELLPHDPRFRLLSLVTHDAPPFDGSKPEVFIKLLRNLSQEDDKIFRLFLAVFFLALMGRGTMERSIIHLYSEEGGAGKGTLINVIQEVVGDRGISLTLKGLTDDSTLSSCEGKTFIAFPEERESLSNSSRKAVPLLKLSSSDIISGRIIYEKGIYQFRSRALIVIASNTHIFPNDGGFNRRVLVVKTSRPKEYIPQVLIKIREEIPKIIQYVLEEFEYNPRLAEEYLEEIAKNEVIKGNLLESIQHNDITAKFVAEFISFVRYTEDTDTKKIPIEHIWWMTSLYQVFKAWAVFNYQDIKCPNNKEFEISLSLLYSNSTGVPLQKKIVSRKNELDGAKKRYIGLALHLDDMAESLAMQLKH